MSLKKHNIYGIIAAVIYTITVIILLFLLGFTTPLPLPPEEAILIDFGGGNINAGASSSTNTSNAQNTSSQISSHDGVNTQANEEAPFMQSGTNPTENPKKNEDETETQETTAPTNPNADRLNNLFGGGVFGGGTGSGTAGTGTGGGNPGLGTGGTGTGSGPGGIGGGIGNRRILKKVDPIGKDNMIGKVVLKIIVNDKGNVTSVTLVSTNCNECVQPAIDAIKQWKYEAKPGTGDQTGNVTIEFQQV
ncbi:MAG TPA: TonB family protein [Bacteroidales bacterium]|nr:TonB family protein [Bacteroidales bacterium]HOR60042.1 TonB family protein [Bacteroidales bacterium]HPL04394.1 TonB family protein [Bacteroidales bacterium]HPX76411.1 TonB family protein [Bacteroidales bacterium]